MTVPIGSGNGKGKEALGWEDCGGKQGHRLDAWGPKLVMEVLRGPGSPSPRPAPQSELCHQAGGSRILHRLLSQEMAIVLSSGLPEGKSSVKSQSLRSSRQPSSLSQQLQQQGGAG